MSPVRMDIDEGGLEHIRTLAKRVRNNALDDMKPEAERNAPILSGELFLSIDVDHEAGQLRADAPHAAAVELGSSPHEIPNAWGRGITVQHPGGPAQPYLRPAAFRQRPLRA